jgi:hypothetical protein
MMCRVHCTIFCQGDTTEGAQTSYSARPQRLPQTIAGVPCTIRYIVGLSPAHMVHMEYALSNGVIILFASWPLWPLLVPPTA